MQIHLSLFDGKVQADGHFHAKWSFVLKPLTQSQQVGDGVQADYKHKSRLVICGNFASLEEHSTTTTDIDAPLLRLMLSLGCSTETAWSRIDVTSAFLNADIHDDDTVLVTPPPI